MRATIDKLFGDDREKAKAAAEALQRGGVNSATDARDMLEALGRDVTPVKGLFVQPKQALLSAIQACKNESARAILRTDGPEAIINAYPKLRDNEKTFALKDLALLGSAEALNFLVNTLKDLNGPKAFMVSMALQAIDPKTPNVDVLFPALAPVLAYPDFRAVAVLDLANALVRAGTLRDHPGADHLEKLRSFIESPEKGRASYAVSACLALAFIPGTEAEKLLFIARSHSDGYVRLEGAHALALRHHSGGEQMLVEAARNPETSLRAIEYLQDIDKGYLIPVEVHEPLFGAKSRMLSWLIHPMEYGRPPESIELWERRTLYWPPTDDQRELFLFKYVYPPRRAGEAADTGVGLVGSRTFSLFGITKPSPSGTIEDALAAHCVWELDMSGDLRGHGQKLEVGRKLLGVDD